MAEVIRMPKMSDTMSEGLLVKWLKLQGDKVSSGDILAEVETDKAVMELENYEEGTLLHLAIKEGERVPVDGLIAVVGEEGEDVKALLDKEGAAAKAESGNGKSPSGTRNAEEVLPARPTAEVSIPSSTQGSTQGSTQAPTTPQVLEASSDRRLKASPLARKMAKERQLNLRSIQGTGDAGRIIKRDIEAAATQGLGSSAVLAGVGDYEDIPLSQMRQTIAVRLAESKFSAPHFYLGIQAEVSALVEARKKLNEENEERVSFNDFIIKASAQALMRHPEINASWHEQHIRRYAHAHIGVAVSVAEGLLVPVVRHAEEKGLAAISKEVKSLASLARERKLQPEQWQGSTFAISNLGMYGIGDFTAIINSPNAAILAVGAVADQPVVVDGALRVGKVLSLTLSCDHRVIDGAMGAAFLKTLKSFLTNPLSMLY